MTGDEPDSGPSEINELVRIFAERAARILDEHPDWRLALLVLEKGSIGYKRFRTAVEQTNGQELSDRWIAGLARLDMALALLDEAEGPGAGESFLRSMYGPGRRLPVILNGRDGFLTNSVALPDRS